MNKYSKLALGLSIALLAAGCSDDSGSDNVAVLPQPEQPQEQQPLALPQSQLESSWFKVGQQAVARAQAQTINNTPGAAKNIILFIGDGMGISTVTAARILAGQQQGLDGEEYQLSFEKMPFAGLVKTYNTNQQTPDSAGTATAIMTGVKTKAGVINVDETVPRGDCAASKQRPLTTVLELAEGQGKSTGIISTARVTHATPAATYAKVPDRDWEYKVTDGDCTDIAAQLVALNAGDGIDVIMGGGRRNFLPSSETDAEGAAGKREDGRNLVDEWLDRYNDGVTNAVYIEDQTGFNALDVAGTDKLLGLFNPSHMHYEADRGNDTAGEPSLSEMTAKGLELLSKNDKGYFLMVEGGRIDHGHHAGSAYNALTDAVELAEAVQVAMDKTSAEDTLIIVTADHSHVMTIAGYPTRGNPILGKVITNDGSGQPEETPALAADGLPYTTLGYTTGRGHADYGETADADERYGHEIDTGRKDLTNVDTTAPGYHQEALIPTSAETHGGEDVGVWARGPGAHWVTGTNEQSYLFHVMARAGGLLD
ncbi:alkaline phosphatase [Microbulbifer thermotolerans]|uniref:Alkaline phosphatase n=1 Tax=Microbulbifer thermotolerans TaxID=252514 RepID=A0A143HQR5_MICTH|nr:alkaline phosphatase [Microbulbifer thermotolerans]AMX03831.1 alkaline phosphatase [Microbulbifer thermotolerans]MCX2778672.1 alkaline phosphatase [Microbulbifer thermotolerans]MCX2803819.1 alkaline phosphatase [Microbulbifer thermotolerans]MCX2833267.1 alkaline phosphatase [Microbulbifer thermotolerans]MCX2841039.1 alkaline phosphatase [Microbulbifer thermotolerans]